MSNIIKKAFDEIHAEKQLTESTASAVTAKMRFYKTKPAVRICKRVAVAAACFITLCAGASAHKLYFTEVSAISLDINPSIEMSINRFDKIIKIEGLNEDGKNIVKVLNLKYKDYDKAVDMILSSTQLNNDADIVVTVLSADDDRKDRIIENLQTYSENCWRNMKCLGGDPESVEKAHDCGLSFGKYRALLELQKYAPEYTSEDVMNMSMQEIRRLIKEYSESGGVDINENSDGVCYNSTNDSFGNGQGYTDDDGDGICDNRENGHHSSGGHGRRHHEQ